jgi:hypothetical protein
MPNALAKVSREIATLRRSLRAVDRSLRRLAPKLQAVGNVHTNGNGAAPRRKINLSPKRRAQLKLQGMYIGYMRQLSQKNKRAVRSIFQSKGMKAAVAKAKQLH